MLYDITASIVLYKNDVNEVRTVMLSFLSIRKKTKLFLIDNSPTNTLKPLLDDLIAKHDIVYMHSTKNVGFGAAHNIAMRNAIKLAPYHIVLNPDIEFKSDVIDNMFNFMQANEDVGQLLPNVYYSNGDVQKHCKLLPGPLHLIGRRFLNKLKWAEKKNKEYELEDFKYDRCLDTPNLCGCFMFLRTACLKTTGLFDTRFFMYLEDVDLTRRIHKISKTLFYPFVSIVHNYQRGSYKDLKLLFYHIQSAVNYFTKWGWLVDKEKDKFNGDVLNSIQNGSLQRLHPIQPNNVKSINLYKQQPKKIG